jgi:hypothetical protein
MESFGVSKFHFGVLTPVRWRRFLEAFQHETHQGESGRLVAFRPLEGKSLPVVASTAPHKEHPLPGCFWPDPSAVDGAALRRRRLEVATKLPKPLAMRGRTFNPLITVRGMILSFLFVTFAAQ